MVYIASCACIESNPHTTSILEQYVGDAEFRLNNSQQLAAPPKESPNDIFHQLKPGNSTPFMPCTVMTDPLTPIHTFHRCCKIWKIRLESSSTDP